MRIVYGLAGEGLGHASVALELIPFLEKNGHKVKVITYGQSLERLKKFDPIKIGGIHLFYSKNGLSLIKTFAENLGLLKFYIFNFGRIRKKISDFKPDIFITNFEPLTALMSYYFGKPLISISNQHELLYLKNVPWGHKMPFEISRIATHLNPPKADKYIIMSLNKLDVKSPKVTVAKLIIREEITKMRPEEGGSVLVYLNKPNDELINTLKNVNEKFVIYGYGKKRVNGNLQYKKTGPGFAEDLRKCKAVVATTGLSLILEAIYLKKPFFGVPLKKQFEQTMNAIYLKDSGFGDYSESPSAEDIKRFFGKLKIYRARLKKNKVGGKDAKEALLRVIKEFG